MIIQLGPAADPHVGVKFLGILEGKGQFNFSIIDQNITRLNVAEILNEKQTEKARIQLFRQICDAIRATDHHDNIFSLVIKKEEPITDTAQA